jgi:tricorn protease
MKPARVSAFVVPILAAVAMTSGPAFARPAYVRYPDLHENRVVFCAEADIWLTTVDGDAPYRLTTHPGTEYFPAFSPDGKQIAFTGEYDGNRDVFVVSSGGGEPRRITWHPGSDEVLGWTPDGKRILFRSQRRDPHGSWEIFQVSAQGGDAEVLPLGWAARLDIDPKSGRWAFNRKSRETRTWKRYRGGTAPSIWVGDPDRADYEKVTEFNGNDTFPMWHDGRIYFLSDQGGTSNIWSINPDGSDRRQHTEFDVWDARWPAMGSDGRIAFTLAADVHIFDPSGGKVRKVEIDLPSDSTLTRNRYPNPGRTMTWLDLSPDGDRLAVVTRGEIFSVPVKDGVTLPVTRGSGARERRAGFSPDGKRLIYITDEPREEEIRVIDAWGRGEPDVIKPAGDSGWYFPPLFSPDEKWVAYADQTHTLWVVSTEGGKPRRVDRSTQREIRDYTWSPDGRWLAYTKSLPTEYRSVFIYDTQDGAVHEVTGATTDDFSPSWDPKGRYIYFLSDRATNPVIGGRDWQNIELKSTRPFMALLRKDVENPFANLAGMPPSEEEEEEDEDEGEEQDEDGDDDKASKKSKKGSDEEGDDKGKDDEDKKKLEPVEIDLEGLPTRLVQLPVKRGLYFGLSATPGGVLYVAVPVKGMAEMPGIFEDAGPPDATLLSFSLESKESKPFMDGIAGYTLARGGEKAAVVKGRGEVYVVDTGSPPGDLSKAKVSLDGIVIELDPREEWEQIYYEGWRHMREFYWDAGMGGVDWKKVRDQYATLLPRLSTRDDLRDLMGEVIGELSTSHTYVFGGDPGRRVSRVSTGLAGADLERDNGFYRVSRIYHGDAADNAPSPLLQPGVEMSEGDYILAVNNLPFSDDRPFYASLEARAGKEVVLTVNDKPSTEGSREVVVRTLPSERRLRYVDWVRGNREHVAEKTDGVAAYIHIPDMWKDGLIEFNTWFYPQLDKEAMVVDVRWNGGGAVSQMILERFRRPVVSFDRSRGGGVTTYPYRTLNGPFVVLLNEFAGSDGDIFPMAVQLEGLAPIIGTRSWGGVVGIRGDKSLVDGGLLTQPEFAWWDPQHGWELENTGVVPDIEVQNLPQELAKGVDAQLDRAVKELMKMHREDPPIEAAFGPPRDRSRDAYRKELATEVSQKDQKEKKREPSTKNR